MKKKQKNFVAVSNGPQSFDNRKEIKKRMLSHIFIAVAKHSEERTSTLEMLITN